LANAGPGDDEPGQGRVKKLGKVREKILRPSHILKDQAEATFYRVSSELLGPAVEKWLLRQTM
jgi:hypothetical protein